MQPCRHAPSRLDRRAAGGSHGTDAEQAEKDAKQHHVPAFRGDRQLKLQTPNSKLQTPKKLQVQRSKHQTPEKLQAPSSKSKRGPRFGAWNLGFLWCLELGFWCFDSGISLELGVWDWVFPSLTSRPEPIHSLSRHPSPWPGLGREEVLPPIKAPNTKHQIPKKLQVPSSKHQRSSKLQVPTRSASRSLELGFWCFGFLGWLFCHCLGNKSPA